jgi:hypothetical protein
MKAFGKAEVVEQPSFDESTFCTHPGCSGLWSVKAEGERPKCSFHQWQQTDTGHTPRNYVIPPLVRSDIPHSDKSWAEKLIAKHEGGERVAPYSLRLAQAALRLTT